MTRREMLRECRDGAMRNLPHLLGTAGGLWAGLAGLVAEETPTATIEQPSCFTSAPVTEPSATIPENAGE